VVVSSARSRGEQKVVELSIRSRFELLDLVHNAASAVLREAGFDDDARFWLTVAIREAVNNAIKHGNRLDARKLVRVRFEVGREELKVWVRDRGRGFEPNRLPSPLEADNLLKGGGRGVYFMRKFMDKVRYVCRSSGCNEVCMIKRLPRAGKGPEKEEKR
jgi:serine/threonine-protein kinase RsbW